MVMVKVPFLCLEITYYTPSFSEVHWLVSHMDQTHEDLGLPGIPQSISLQLAISAATAESMYNTDTEYELHNIYVQITYGIYRIFKNQSQNT